MYVFDENQNWWGARQCGVLQARVDVCLHSGALLIEYLHTSQS